jgi:hypothetical protein
VYRLFFGVLFAIYASSAFSAVGIKVSEDRVYTLYRSSVLGEDRRCHVATFDADEEQEYNRENCEIARGLFQNQPGVKVRY